MPQEYRSSIVEPILNHLTMKTTGALLLTGVWGSGKTYHIKKHIFPIVEQETKYQPIIISVYGEKDKEGIAQKVLFAYLDSKANSKVSLGSIGKTLKDIASSLPIVKKYVDVDKFLSGTGESAFWLIPKNELLICFDDVERLSDKMKIEDFLGIINDLVENKGCKVLLIANEEEIPDGIKFKEKTIEKTIHFIPEISEILDSIISEYPESEYKKYLHNNRNIIIQSLDLPEDEKLNKELKKSFTNIRTLKFALEHFKIAFEILVDKEINEVVLTQLKNIWAFTLAVSVEFRKPNNISFNNKKNLDQQFSTPFDLEDLDFLSVDGQENNQKEADTAYDVWFKKVYFKRISETYIFHEDIYNLITSSKTIDKEIFLNSIADAFKIKEGIVNPAHEILSSMLREGYWNYTDEEFVSRLNSLLSYCENGVLEDIGSYLNASAYIGGFSHVINVDKEEILNKIKLGVDTYFSRLNFVDNVRAHYEMLISNFKNEHVSTLLQYIGDRIVEREAITELEDLKNLQLLFESNLSEFVETMLPENTYFRTPEKPLLHKLGLDVVKNGMNNAQPKGIKSLVSLFVTRYLTTGFTEYLTDEMEFIIQMEEAIGSMDFTGKPLSEHIIKNELAGKIAKAKAVLQTKIEKKEANKS